MARNKVARANVTGSTAGSTSTPLRFHEAFRKARRKLRLKQADVARALAVSSRSVHLWDNGRTKPDHEHLRGLVAWVATFDGAVADEVAAAAGHSRASLGVTTAAKGGALPSKLLVEGLLWVAAEALGASPPALRTAVAALLERMVEAGLDPADVARALRHP